MIFKSYILEQDIKKIENYRMFLFYGENHGLKKDFKENIKKNKKNAKVINFLQSDVIKNKSILTNEIYNKSLFEEKKIIFIDEINDKILNILEEIKDSLQDDNIYLFANILEKKSKVRNFFEKTKTCGVSACYSDNEISIRKIITNKLKTLEGFNSNILNIIIQNTGLDRDKINNELEKIITLFNDKKINEDQLMNLLNLKTNEDFNELKDAAFNGNKQKTNKLLNETTFENDSLIYYINNLNQRINKILEINSYNKEKSNIENIIDKIKPPVFWKDKPVLINQSKIWNKKKLLKAQKKTYITELRIKSNSKIKSDLLIKNLIVNLCLLAKSA